VEGEGDGGREMFVVGGRLEGGWEEQLLGSRVRRGTLRLRNPEQNSNQVALTI
jgi:hypothetical protein